MEYNVAVDDFSEEISNSESNGDGIEEDYFSDDRTNDAAPKKLIFEEVGPYLYEPLASNSDDSGEKPENRTCRLVEKLNVDKICEWQFFPQVLAIPPCYAMYKNKTTKNVPFLFFLISDMNSLFGACYGTLTGNFTIFVINTVGFLLWGLYILVYLFVSKTKLKSVFMVLLMMAIAGIHLKYVGGFVNAKEMTAILGQIMFVWSNILLLTPILDIVSAVQQGSADGMSLSLLVGCTLSSLSWFLYGYMLKDLYVYGPNVPGTVVNIGKFITLYIYRQPSKSTKVE